MWLSVLRSQALLACFWLLKPFLPFLPGRRRLENQLVAMETADSRRSPLTGTFCWWCTTSSRASTDLPVKIILVVSSLSSGLRAEMHVGHLHSFRIAWILLACALVFTNYTPSFSIYERYASHARTPNHSVFAKSARSSTTYCCTLSFTRSCSCTSSRALYHAVTQRLLQHSNCLDRE